MEMNDFEKIYKALANRRRLVILKFIHKQREASVGEISEHIRLSFKSTSRHIAVLRTANIIDKEQRGLEAYYHIEDQHPIIKHFLSIV
ncbi:MAG: metalloregulator ArsR/SmtB family transcription factor [Candidatus Doudnabacteria bacterium]|nr:metalloregulator ArsR/SmtB family transcription factor [Candidatus Doudnabacteria bacterium]